MENLNLLDQKIVSISALIGDDKANSDIYLERSKLLFSKQLYRQALEDAKSALQLNPKYLDAILVAGKTCLKLKRFEECYAYYKHGLELDSKNEEIVKDLKLLQNLIVAEYEQQGQDIQENTYNAVHLCSQDVYPDDDELFKMESEIIEKKYRIDRNKQQMPVQVDLNKRKDAASIGVMAHNCRMSGQLQEALQCCQVAFGIDPSNYRLLHMRAEVLRDLGEDVKALQDLFSIPKAYRFADVWKMGGIILSKLNLPVMAEFWLRKATAMVPEKDKSSDLEAATLFQKVRVKRIYGPLAMNFPVSVEFTEYGRAVVATKTLQPGENAFDDIPLVVGQLLNCLHFPACSHCGLSLITAEDYIDQQHEQLPSELRSFVTEYWPDVSGEHCKRCKLERYCSAACREEAWNSYHQIICPTVNDAAAELYTLIENRGYGTSENGTFQDLWDGQYSPIVLAKIWGMIVSEAKRLMKQSGLIQPTPEMWARAKMPFRKFISFGSISAVQRIPEIFSLMKRIFADCGDGIAYPISEGEFEARYYQATCNLQAFSSSVDPRHKFMVNISRLEDIRALRMLKYLEQKSPAVSFAGLFPLHACLNHACDNNVEVMDGFANGKPAVHVRVKRLIESGKELLTTYIDTSMPRKLRRAWLYRSFNFWCMCKRCQFEGDDNITCTHCKKAASDGNINLACSRCKRAWYCSKKCQKQSWINGHKDICNLEHTSVYAQNIKHSSHR